LNSPSSPFCSTSCNRSRRISIKYPAFQNRTGVSLITWDDSSIRIICKKTTLRSSMVVNRLTQALKGTEANGNVDQRPLLGIFSCLICERHFSTKYQLKRHYCRRHQDTIPNLPEGTHNLNSNRMDRQNTHFLHYRAATFGYHR